MGYRIGDEVTIKRNLVEGATRLGFVTKDMVHCRGEKAIVRAVLDDGYRINADNGNWAWTIDMFEEGVLDMKKRIVKIIMFKRDSVVDGKIFSTYATLFCGVNLNNDRFDSHFYRIESSDIPVLGDFKGFPHHIMIQFFKKLDYSVCGVQSICLDIA